MIKLYDRTYKFKSVFNPRTGFYIRSGIINEAGKDSGVDPFRASFPQLIDIGIMGHCQHGISGKCLESGIDCYQDGLHLRQPNMSLADFRRIIEESRFRTFQVALGGRGDPDQHESIAEILAFARNNGVIPNFTTSGYNFTPEKAELCRKYCGAVAVSWYRRTYTQKTLKLLLESGVKTNIHYVLSGDSIEEAIHLLENGGLPRGLNAIIFLLYKPVGLGHSDKVLQPDNPHLERFFSRIDRHETPFKIGFDSCTVPALLNRSTDIDPRSIDTCEGARFSCYISPDLKMVPCSFDRSNRWSYDLTKGTIKEGWESPSFQDFRDFLTSACPDCQLREHCMGGCPIEQSVVLCDRPEREIFQTNLNLSPGSSKKQ